jgi:aryl-alcohol dehydrogenase-like predicted oxidoreductase
MILMFLLTSQKFLYDRGRKDNFFLLKGKELIVIKGYGTPEGTASYAERHAPLTYGDLGGTGLLVSQAGFGCYRVDVSVEAHDRALTKALLEGINLIDTSANYADGGSEALVGKVLTELIASGKLSREEIVVVTKGGYLQGVNYEISQQRNREGKPFPDLVPYGEGIEHCIHPEFLEDQIGRSLGRLNLETIDLYLLHNPEYYLGWAAKGGLSLEAARREYYRRIELALRHLENEAARGRVRFYGISSNTFPSPDSDHQFTSLDRVWETAESVSRAHHFRVIQLPLNFLETGGVTEGNQSGGRSVIELAREKGLGVLINRPLNAIAGRGMLRLADVEAGEPLDPEEVEHRIRKVVRSEEELRERVFAELSLTASSRDQIMSQAAVGETLLQHWRDFGSHDRWQELQAHYFVPRVRALVPFLQEHADRSRSVFPWLETYQERLLAAFQAVTSVYQGEAARRSRLMRSWIASVDSLWAEAKTLSQMAARALRSTAGVTCVLVGMRREKYVEDVLAELREHIGAENREESWTTLRETQEGILASL